MPPSFVTASYKTSIFIFILVQSLSDAFLKAMYQKLFEKLNFQKEGLLREHFIINENPENEVIYGLLKTDCN